MPKISKHAVVARPENLAEDVVVGAFAYVGPDVTIGRGSRVDNNATLDGRVRVGSGCHIYPFAIIGARNENGFAGGTVLLGERNQIREHAVICPGLEVPTRIGDDNLISIGCSVGPGCTIADHTVLGTYSYFADCTHIERNVWASAFTGTHPGITIGRYSFTSGYAGIDRDAPPYAMLQGFPFRVRGVNTNNLKRCGFSEEAIAGLKQAFRDLFNGDNGCPTSEALHAWREKGDLDEHQQYLVDFLIDRRESGS